MTNYDDIAPSHTISVADRNGRYPRSSMADRDDRSDRSGKSAKKGSSSKAPSASSTPRQLSSLDADVQQIHLFAAVRAEKLETIKKLVPPASLQTHELSTGETPLHVAVDTGHAKVRRPAALAPPIGAALDALSHAHHLSAPPRSSISSLSSALIPAIPTAMARACSTAS